MNLGAPEGREAPVVIPDVANGGMYSPDSFLLPPHYKMNIEGIMIPKGVVNDRTEKLAVDIRDMYGNEEVHMICVLKVFFGN